MKKFVLQSSIFVLPFLFLYFVSSLYGSVDKGDLLRIGNIIDNTADYRKKFEHDFSQEVCYSKLSDVTTKKNYDILTMGDSFSQQQNSGYQNYLSLEEGLDVLHYNGSTNAIGALYGLINGDIFDKLAIKYVLVESVERNFVGSSQGLDKTHTTTLSSFKSKNTGESKKNLSPRLFSSAILKFPLYNFLYLFNDRAFFSKVYQTSTTKELFSVKGKRLLFYSDDISQISANNDAIELNAELNILEHILKEKNVGLIVLPAPDKYDVYYDYIRDKSKYPKPHFFESMSKQKKNYIYIDAKTVISNAVKNTKDVYFYDDTHWSPIGAKLIAKTIRKSIESDL